MLKIPHKLDSSYLKQIFQFGERGYIYIYTGSDLISKTFTKRKEKCFGRLMNNMGRKVLGKNQFFFLF